MNRLLLDRGSIWLCDVSVCVGRGGDKWEPGRAKGKLNCILHLSQLDCLV